MHCEISIHHIPVKIRPTEKKSVISAFMSTNLLAAVYKWLCVLLPSRVFFHLGEIWGCDFRGLLLSEFGHCCWTLCTEQAARRAADYSGEELAVFAARWCSRHQPQVRNAARPVPSSPHLDETSRCAGTVTQICWRNNREKKTLLFLFQFFIKVRGTGGNWHHAVHRVRHHCSALSALQNGLCSLPHQPVLPGRHLPETHVSHPVKPFCFRLYSFSLLVCIQFLFVIQEWESRVQAKCGAIREEPCLSEASSSFLPRAPLPEDHKN